MVRVYDEVDLDDMSYDEIKEVFHFPCPCGDRFEISMAQLRDEVDIARCPSCSLIIRVIFDPVRVSLLPVYGSRHQAKGSFHLKLSSCVFCNDS